jgi:ABC-type lipoprotein export system ATPase subunit
MAPVLEMLQVQKVYPGPDGALQTVLDVEHFHVEAGQQLALRGRSGSGKSTLLNLVAGILAPDRGKVILDGQELGKLSESQRDHYRGRKLGYVFQSFHLLQALTVWENLWMASVLSGSPDEKRLDDFLTRLDLQSRRHHKPAQLSLGQQQRVAVARALVHKPKLVLADEPTGNLDAELAQQALRLLREMCGEIGAALLLVSHDEAVLNQFVDHLDLRDINKAAPC